EQSDPTKKGKEEGSSEIHLYVYDPLYFHPNDIGSQLISFKLKETENYKIWSATVQLALHSRNKLGFINGKCIKDETDALLEEQWNRIHSFTQAGIPLFEYYHNFNAMWREFDILVNLPQCSCDGASTLKKHNDLLRDESHRKSQQTSGNKDNQHVFAARSNDWKNNKSNGQTNQNRSFIRNTSLVCKHCHMTGHTIDRCFELIGYPIGFKKRSNNNQTTGVASNNAIPVRTSGGDGITHALTSDQYKRLMNLLSSSGYHVSFLSVNKLSKDSKVVVIVNESKFFIHDSAQKSLMGTSSESYGLLGHPADQVIEVLKEKLNIDKFSTFDPCESKDPNDEVGNLSDSSAKSSVNPKYFIEQVDHDKFVQVDEVGRVEPVSVDVSAGEGSGNNDSENPTATLGTTDEADTEENVKSIVLSDTDSEYKGEDFYNFRSVF
ncbi:putative transcription factor interactor and regulator CCHC(Zn) family protein, partial [Tanacetum coccineum]